MYTLTFTKHRWVPLASLGFALIGGGLWTLSGITLMSFLAITALQLAVVLPYWRARVMATHWKAQLTGSVRLAETMITRLHLSTASGTLQEAINETKGE